MPMNAMKSPAVCKQHKSTLMNQNRLNYQTELTVFTCALKYGRKPRWRKKRVARDKEIKGMFVWVFADVSSGASPGLSTLRTKPISLCAVSLRTYSQSRHRQTAAIKPWLFQVHRVWKGLIEGLWSQWGWSSSPSSPLSHWKVGGGGRGGGGGLGRGLKASRDLCFLLSRPKWNLDKNTPLVAACPWAAAISANTEMKCCPHH